MEPSVLRPLADQSSVLVEGVLLAAFGVTIVFEGLKVAGVIAGASSGALATLLDVGPAGPTQRQITHVRHTTPAGRTGRVVPAPSRPLGGATPSPRALLLGGRDAPARPVGSEIASSAVESLEQ